MINEVPQEIWIATLREVHNELDRLIEAGGASASELELWREELDLKIRRILGVTLRDRRKRR